MSDVRQIIHNAEMTLSAAASHGAVNMADELAAALRDAITELARGVVAEEPEWEWALMADGDDEPWSDCYKTREHLAERCGGLAWRDDERLVRRRAPGPWVAVEQEGERDA